jgi:alpha-1,3-rhamnosyl/mannosyltransferase
LKPLAHCWWSPTVGRRSFLTRPLIEARVWRETRVPLILAGPYGWRQRALVQRVRSSSGAVHWLGWVPDKVLGALFRRATAVVQPSLAEGLDLPVLEAMAAGKPLVLSDLPVHREVAADSALYAEATDVGELSDQLDEALSWDGERRSDHARRAAARVQSLRARSGIELYLEIYRRVRQK